ncbi:MAG TPA: methanol/ethanol family PQQ-dependent dehydrogenase [Candidatus Binataceae bacterium]|nr:methanol/ethanol family PQQ-dependent dehydrogenase [Candidatus Binataceae bacterium]
MKAQNTPRGSLTFLLIACFICIPSLAHANSMLAQMSTDANQWVMPGGNYAVTRFSKLKQITADNAKRLQVAWTMSTGALRGHEGQPLVVGNMMYFESAYPNYIFAVDLDDVGRMVWKFEPPKNPDAPPVACCDVVNRGVAYADGKVIASILDGHVYALDAKTGKVLWTADNADPLKGQTVTAAPLVVKDKVIIGVSGGEFGVLGYLSAFDLNTGKLAWRAYSAGPDEGMLFDPAKTINANEQKPVGKDSSLSTWQGDQWKLGGGTTWGWYSYDPKLNLLYYGTGNPGSWNPTQRPGDNRWSMSIIARNPDTGVAAWAFQMTPHDGWDYDGVNEDIVVDLDVKGHTVPCIVHFDRNGYCWVLDRRNGKLVAVHKYDPSVNWATRINPVTGRPDVDPSKMTKAGVNVKHICPAAEGDKDEQPASYDPATGLFYVPTNHICMDYQAFDVKYKAGFPYVGAILNMYPASPDVRGRFIAFDAITGATKWAINDRFQDWSGVLTTAGGVGFYGTLDGWFRAVNLKTGKILYQFKCPSGIIGNPITYTHKGKQYVAVLTGVGGWAAIGLAAGLTKGSEGLGAVGLTASLGDYTNLGGTLMVFALSAP